VLALDDALALVGVLARPSVLRSSTDGWASLTCRNSGSSVVAAEHQQDPGAGADAADPDDLAGHVDERNCSSRCRRSDCSVRR
jgi:hypothetical protein